MRWSPWPARSPPARRCSSCATVCSPSAGRRSSTPATSPPRRPCSRLPRTRTCTSPHGRTTVLQASADSDVHQSTWSPAPIAEVVAAIEREKPDVVFAPHVETASGMLLPDDYVKAVSEAVHAVGGLFVLDCIASGAVWASMTDLGVDILISAPQKCWSGSP